MAISKPLGRSAVELTGMPGMPYEEGVERRAWTSAIHHRLFSTSINSISYDGNQIKPSVFGKRERVNLEPVDSITQIPTNYLSSM
jgi:hypothetical protein